MTPHTPPATSARKTRWGDREGRRRDILDAARRQMADHGYLGLNMRDVAAGAGVSPGTLYSYFATKDEIFATLYAEAVSRHNEEIAPLCREATELEPFLVELFRAYLGIWTTYGRYFSLWSTLAAEEDDGAAKAAAATPSDEASADGSTDGGDAGASHGRLPRDLTAELRAAARDQGAMITETLRRLLPGPHPPGEGRRRMAFLWSVQVGLSDHLSSDRHLLSRVGVDDLIDYAARSVAAGLRANAAPAD